jgi:hypothetical protein
MGGESARLMRKYVCTEQSRPVDSDELPVPAESKYVNLSLGEEIQLPPLSFVLLTSLSFDENVTVKSDITLSGKSKKSRN